MVNVENLGLPLAAQRVVSRTPVNAD
jgi:hypothetical protein